MPLNRCVTVGRRPGGVPNDAPEPAVGDPADAVTAVPARSDSAAAVSEPAAVRASASVWPSDGVTPFPVSMLTSPPAPGSSGAYVMVLSVPPAACSSRPSS